MDKESLKQKILETFTGFSSDITEIKLMLMQKPESFNGTVWATVQGIYEILLPIGFSLIALFFIIDFLNKSVMLEYMRWENVVKSLLKLVVAKLIMENSFMLLNSIFMVVSNMISKTSGVYAESEEYHIDLQNLLTTVDGMGFWQRMSFAMNLQPWIILMWGIKIAVYIIVYGRFIELFIMSAVAPLPLATLAGENTSDIAKRFLKTYIGVCLQGLVLLIGCMIYGSLITSIGSSGDGMEMLRHLVLVSMVLLIIFVKSGSWAKQLTGAA